MVCVPLISQKPEGFTRNQLGVRVSTINPGSLFHALELYCLVFCRTEDTFGQGLGLQKQGSVSVTGRAGVREDSVWHFQNNWLCYLLLLSSQVWASYRSSSKYSFYHCFWKTQNNTLCFPLVVSFDTASGNIYKKVKKQNPKNTTLSRQDWKENAIKASKTSRSGAS